jgi:hypothetical protein
MIKYEIKKASSIFLFIVFGIAFILLILTTFLFMKNSSMNVSNNEKYYNEVSEYNEEKYNELVKEASIVYESIAEVEDEVLKDILRKKYSELNAKQSLYRDIYKRKDNIEVFMTYRNWESSLKYSYDINEEYQIKNTSMWNSFFKYPLYEYVSIAIIIILAIVIYTSDNKEGNRKVLYSTYKGKYSINNCKRILTYICTILITSVSLMIQLIVSICMGLDMSIMNVGLYQLEEFPYAPSFMSIGSYMLYMILAHIIFNIMIVMLVDFITCLIDKKIFVTILTVLFIVVLGVFKEDMWINPIRIIDMPYFFDNVREVTIGNYVVHQYIIVMAIIILLGALFTMLAKVTEMLKVETE